MKTVLTIAGSDSSGGAGIQADLKTIAAHHLYGMSVITALTAQNTCGVFGIEDVDPEFVTQQIDAVFDDIRPDAVKIGMVFSPDIAVAVARALARHNAQHIVVDPVMVSTSGASLVADDVTDALVEWLFPLAEIVTPNLDEACVLSGIKINCAADVERAASVIAERTARRASGVEPVTSGDAAGAPDSTPEGSFDNVSDDSCAVLIKGGHADDAFDTATETADDMLRLSDGSTIWLGAARVDTHNTHGTGCTLSSAIACGLACGFSVEKSVRTAKNYVVGALEAGLDLGQGSGPLDHMWMLDEQGVNP